MKHIKTFEEVNKVEYVEPTKEHPSYKNDIKKKKSKKIKLISVPPNHTKDVISFKPNF